MRRYMCINRCYINDQLFDVGQIVPEDKILSRRHKNIPRHFDRLDVGVAGKLETARRRLDELGVEYDPTDGIDLLLEKIGDETEVVEVPEAPPEIEPSPSMKSRSGKKK